jgi:hypothetical protein
MTGSRGSGPWCPARPDRPQPTADLLAVAEALPGTASRAARVAAFNVTGARRCGSTNYRSARGHRPADPGPAGGRTRSQDPITSVQGHAIYSFPRSVWASIDATYFTGGRTAVDGEANSDLQRNWRLGATLAVPLSVHHSVKLYASGGVSARTGNNYDLIGIALQYRWGGGL